MRNGRFIIFAVKNTLMYIKATFISEGNLREFVLAQENSR